jgi:hypothetical protein
MSLGLPHYATHTKISSSIQLANTLIQLVSLYMRNMRANLAGSGVRTLKSYTVSRGNSATGVGNSCALFPL